MKRAILLTLFSVVLISNHSFAQTDPTTSTAPKKDTTPPKVNIGVKLGANFQSVSGSLWDHGYQPGLTGGITVGMHKHKIGVRAEVLMSMSTFKSKAATDSIGDKSNVTAINIDVPVLFEYDVIRWLTILVGPQYSNILSAKDPNNLNQNPKLDFKGSSFSGVLGVEAKLPKHFTVGARYMLGFSNINNGILDQNETDSWKTSAMQVYVGYGIK